MTSSRAQKKVVLRVITSAALCALIACASACQLIPVRLDAPAAPDWRGGGLARGAGHTLAFAAPFADRRQRGSCGVKKDGYNRPSARVLCGESPAVTLARHIAEGLSASGFQLVALPDASPTTLIVSGAVEDTIVEPKLGALTATMEADVWLTIALSTKSGLQAHRSIYVKGTDPYLGGMDTAAQRAYATAVREVAVDAVAAIARFAEQLPFDYSLEDQGR